jgi:UDP:flavonoid glycosyltransferase YjiC (YdhE family)
MKHASHDESSGTTLAALSRGLPLVFVPRIANQPLVASVVAGFGAGIVCDDTAKLTAAVERRNCGYSCARQS